MTHLPIGVGAAHVAHLTTRLPSGRPQVTWDREVESNALVVGRTGSGKSTLLYALALGALRAGNEVVLLDGKGRGTFAPFAGRQRVTAVEHDAMRIVDALRQLGRTIGRRYGAAADAAAAAVATQTRPDYTAPPEVTVILDEYITWLHDLSAGIRGDMVSLLMNACMRAREAGVRVVIATQAPNAEQSDAVLPTPMRRQLGYRVLLGTEEDAARRIVFGRLADVIPPVDAATKGRGVAALVGGEWVQMQTYRAVNPVAEGITETERAAAWRMLPPLAPKPREGAFGLRVVRGEEEAG